MAEKKGSREGVALRKTERNGATERNRGGKRGMECHEKTDRKARQGKKTNPKTSLEKGSKKKGPRSSSGISGGLKTEKTRTANKEGELVHSPLTKQR